MRTLDLRVPYRGMGVVLSVLIAATAHGQNITDLILTKAGNDIQFSWTTGTANYAVAGSDEDPEFRFPRTLEQDIAGTSFTYAGGLLGSVSLQFFTVCGATESPCQAGNYTGGAFPPTAPEVTGTSASIVRVGDDVTFTGRGFSTIATENVIHFPEGIAVVANDTPAPTTTTFVVTIPRGALSGPVYVQVGHQIASSVGLTVRTNATFMRNISAVAFQPTTRDIWVTSRGLSSTWSASHYLSFDGTSWPTTTTETAGSGIMKFLGGQGFDGAESWFYASTNDTQGGQTRTVATNPPGTPSLWTLIFPTTQQVGTRGVATRPDISDEAFFAFINNSATPATQHIRRLNGSGLMDGDYGNFGSENLDFGATAGLAFDQAAACCNLYVSEDNQLRRIAPDQSSSIILTGFTQAMGIAHDQVNDADPGTLLVSDFSESKLYKVDLNQTTLARTEVASVPSTRTATFATHPLDASTCTGLPNVDLSFVLVGETNEIRQIPDPRITIEPSAPTRVWISKLHPDDTYPTSLQSADGQMTITATVAPAPNPPRTIFFRVVDPPDLAPYADGIGTGFWCDNRDPASTAGTFLEGLPSDPTIASAMTDGAGKASVTLNVTDRYAGETYVVQASFDDWTPPNPATKALAQTGVITTWKRIYLEKDKMFREGGILATDASANDTTVTVHFSANLPTCTPGANPCWQIAVFDAGNPFEAGLCPSAPTAPCHEEPYVKDFTIDGNGNFVLELVEADNTTPYSLKRGYSSSPYPFFNQGDSAGIGILGSGFHDVDIGNMWEAYNDAFVEFWVPPDGAGAFPYLPASFFDTLADTGRACQVRRFDRIWFDNFTQGPNITTCDDGLPAATCAANNYFHVSGARLEFNGRTGAGVYDGNLAYVFTDKVEADCALTSGGCTGAKLVDMSRAYASHEKGHIFYVNQCSGLEMHDPRNAWCGETGGACINPSVGTENCLMNTPDGSQPDLDMRADGIDRFDVRDLLLGDPNCSSSPPDPLPGSIRQEVDPQ